MVVVAARQIRDGARVFVGMRLPLLAFALAKRTHAPHATGLFENGLAGGGPAAVITTQALLDFDSMTHEARLASYHPYTTPEVVVAATGWPLQLSPSLHSTPPPTADELAIIRECDPQGFWTS